MQNFLIWASEAASVRKIRAGEETKMPIIVDPVFCLQRPRAAHTLRTNFKKNCCHLATPYGMSSKLPKKIQKRFPLTLDCLVTFLFDKNEPECLYHLSWRPLLVPEEAKQTVKMKSWREFTATIMEGWFQIMNYFTFLHPLLVWFSKF